MKKLDVIHIPNSNIAIRDTEVLRDGVLIFRASSTIAECAILDSHVFLVRSIASPEGNPDKAGTNLLCIDKDGKLLWVAPNLNCPDDHGYDPKHKHTFQIYFDLRIYDKKHPMLLLGTDEKSSAEIDAATGRFAQRQPDVDWSQSHDIAWEKYLELQKAIEAKTFIASFKICAVAPYRSPNGPRPWPPTYFAKEAL